MSESVPVFLQLAGSRLQSLCYVSEGDKQAKPMPGVEAIARMTEMTRLVLCHFNGPNNSNLSALQGLQLQELVLINCPGAPAAIIGTGSMTSLQKLHVVDDCSDEPEYFATIPPFEDDLHKPESAGHQEALELHQLGLIVLKLPNLVHVSGLSKLITVGMAEALSGWYRSQYPFCSMTYYDSHLVEYQWQRMKHTEQK